MERCDDPMDGAGVALSAAGQRRRAELRAALLQRVEGRRRRRRTRAFLAAGLLLALGGLLWLYGTAAIARRPRPQQHGGDAEGDPVGCVRVAIVHDDPGVLARCSATGMRSSVRWLSTPEALAELQRARRADGLMRTGGRIEVIGAPLDSWRITAE